MLARSPFAYALVALLVGCAQPSVTALPSPDTAAGAQPDGGWEATARARIAAGEYAPQVDGDRVRATNRAQDLRAVWGARGLTVADRAGGAEVRLSLRGWGREGAVARAELALPEEGACLGSGEVDAFGDCVRRVEYARPGLTEWWENRAAGLEQGFTVTAPPEGDGALVFEVAVAGATVEVAGDEAMFRREGAEALRYAGLVAYDEAGRELPSWMEETEAGLRLIVDDDGAVGTVTVDPVLTTAAWTAEADQAGASLGRSVASAGDVDGDGFGDVVIGAPAYDNGEADEGRAFVYLGSASGLSTSAAWSAEADQAGAYFGRAVASAGDVNGDGFGDLIVGANYYDGGEADEGRAFVYLGSAAGLSLVAAWTAEPDQPSAHLGDAVAAAGDVNGDGFSDVIIGASQHDNDQNNEGRAFVYLGSASGLSASADWTAESDQESSEFGFAVASAGDVNGDGYGDVIVGADQYDGGETDEGRAFVYLGSSAGLSSSPAWTAGSGQAGGSFGYAVASAGDVNGDGYGDLIVGADSYDDGEADEGRAFVYLGSAAGLSTSAAWTAEADQAGASLGRSVASAGDVNGDGFGDVIVGAPDYDGGETDEGRASVYLGSPAGLATGAAWTAEGDQASAGFGGSVGSAGDVDGDGFGDLITGADGYDDGEADEGAAFVYLGSAAGLATGAAWSAEGDQASASFGQSVASAGDVNGDGFGDLIVGAPTLDNGEVDEGMAFLYLGSASGPSPTAAWSTEADQGGARLGVSVASAGDVDGDGYSDVIVGAHKYDHGESDEGMAFVYLGSAAGLSTSPAWTAEGDQTSAAFGWSVASAGDVDGDGYSDVIVGAYLYADGEDDEGMAFVYLGSAAGPSTSPAWTAGGDQVEARLGWSVSAGDVNGDGYSDVVAGAYLYDNGQPNEGRVFAYHGSASGLSPVAAWTAEPDQASASFGWSVASAGDVDGDGYGDVVIGAVAYDDGETDEGAAFVYLGSAAGLSTSPAWAGAGDQASAYYGTSVGSAGDVNGDGFGDVVVGADNYDGGETNEGRASVYLGSTAGLSTTAAWTAEPDQHHTNFGGAVGSAGDVNGDGYGDLIVGAYQQDDGEADEGGASVYLGNGGDGAAPLALAGQARQPGSSTPIVAGLRSTGADRFDVSVGTARTAAGAGKVALQIEAKPLGAPFDGADLTTGSFSAAGISGVALQQAVTGLTPGTRYHWRARVISSPAEGRPQGWGRWIYGGLSGDPLGSHVATTGSTFYADADGDGYGDPASAILSGSAPAGYVPDATDCDDGDASANPGAIEVCDTANVDEDCDGLADDADPSADPATFSTAYVDADSDGYGGPTGALSCDLPAGYVANTGDCDDADPAYHPDAPEVCTDPNDYNCDGSVQYADVDGDTFAACVECDDTDPTIHPGAPEIAGDGIDQDCDGVDATADTGDDTAATDDSAQTDDSATDDSATDDSATDDSDDTSKDDGTGDDCGCATGASSAGAWLALALALGLRRRR